MSALRLTSPLILLVLAAPASPQSEERRFSFNDLEEMYQAGFDAGYIEGRESATGADRLRQCEMLLSFQDTSSRVCRAREDCVDELAVAVHGGDAYLREVANRCITQAR